MQAQVNHTDDRAQQGRQDDRQRQDLPAAPGAKHRQQLEIAMTHAVLAGDQLEHPEHRPQGHVAGNGAPQRLRQWHEQIEAVDDQPQPHQR
ncbi:hypothetical protein D3C76_1166190 [compost metagenome]